MDDLLPLQISAAAELLRTGQLTAVELTEAVLDRVDRLDGSLHSYVRVLADEARVAAAAADAEMKHGRYRGPLHGIPVAVKDLYDVAGHPTRWGSTVSTETPAQADCTAVARLRKAGAVLTGKLTTTEGAYSEHRPDLPVPINPWHPEAWPGSSSSGSAISVAAGLALGSLATDTGGSIRLPSAMNGVTGLKPTWGRVSRAGVQELAGSLDHVGPMARSARDASLLLDVLAGPDERDPTASIRPIDWYSELARRAFRLGVDHDLLGTFDAETQAMLEDVLDVARDLGWEVVPVTAPPEFASIAHDWMEQCAVEAALAHKDSFPARADEYGFDLRSLLEVGAGLSGVRLQSLTRRRLEFTGRMRSLLDDLDVFLLPGIGIAAPTVTQLDNFGADPVLLAALLVPTAPIDLCGFPAVTLPGAFSGLGVPLGFQLVAGEFDESAALAAAHDFQSATSFHTRVPELS